MSGRRPIRRAAAGIAAVGLSAGLVLVPQAAFAAGQGGNAYGLCQGQGVVHAADQGRPAECGIGTATDAAVAGPTGSGSSYGEASTIAAPDVDGAEPGGEPAVTPEPAEPPQVAPQPIRELRPEFLALKDLEARTLTVAIPTTRPQAVPGDAQLVTPVLGSKVTYSVEPQEVPPLLEQGVPEVSASQPVEVAVGEANSVEPQEVPPLLEQGVPEPLVPVAKTRDRSMVPSVVAREAADAQSLAVKLAAPAGPATSEVAQPSSAARAIDAGPAPALAVTQLAVPRSEAESLTPAIASAASLAHTGVATWTWEVVGIAIAGIGLGSLVIGASRQGSRS